MTGHHETMWITMIKEQFQHELKMTWQEATEGGLGRCTRQKIKKIRWRNVVMEVF